MATAERGAGRGGRLQSRRCGPENVGRELGAHLGQDVPAPDLRQRGVEQRLQRRTVWSLCDAKQGGDPPGTGHGQPIGGQQIGRGRVRYGNTLDHCEPDDLGERGAVAGERTSLGDTPRATHVRAEAQGPVGLGAPRDEPIRGREARELRRRRAAAERVRSSAANEILRQPPPRLAGDLVLRDRVANGSRAEGVVFRGGRRVGGRGTGRSAARDRPAGDRALRNGRGALDDEHVDVRAERLLEGPSPGRRVEVEQCTEVVQDEERGQRGRAFVRRGVAGDRVEELVDLRPEIPDALRLGGWLIRREAGLGQPLADGGAQARNQRLNGRELDARPG